MDKVLITGATGFVGRHCLTSLLSQAREVHAVGRSVARLAMKGVHVHPANLLDAREVAALVGSIKPTHLLHLAWTSTPVTYWTTPENLIWVEASLHLLRRFVQHGGQRALMVGSCAEYDWTVGCCHETASRLLPASLYGISKRALGTLTEGFAHQTGLSAAWARLFFMYGPHEHPKRLVSSVIGSLLAGRPAACSLGVQQRDYLHVQDAADALVALLGSNVRGAVNVGSGEAVSIREVVQTIATLIGRPNLLRLGSVPTPVNEPPLVSADVGRLRDEVRWSPRFSLYEGLSDTIAWWRSISHGNSQAA
jgi:nucleoside-diphosphate-sugar epimerase